MKKKTIWCARDRQGEKYFTERPIYRAFHDIYSGEQISWQTVLEKRKKYRVIKKFKVEIVKPANYNF